MIELKKMFEMSSFCLYAGAIGRQHRRLSSDPNHSTLPTSVASGRSHHGFFSGRLALAERSTLYSPPDLNLDCLEAIMREKLSLVSLLLAFRWFLGLCGSKIVRKPKFRYTKFKDSYKMFGMLESYDILE